VSNFSLPEVCKASRHRALFPFGIYWPEGVIFPCLTFRVEISDFKSEILEVKGCLRI
jgi:hypothetical protein